MATVQLHTCEASHQDRLSSQSTRQKNVQMRTPHHLKWPTAGCAAGSARCWTEAAASSCKAGSRSSLPDGWAAAALRALLNWQALAGTGTAQLASACSSRAQRQPAAKAISHSGRTWQRKQTLNQASTPAKIAMHLQNGKKINASAPVKVEEAGPCPRPQRLGIDLWLRSSHLLFQVEIIAVGLVADGL